ncbi:hypothetical protein AB0O67_35575 [Streptomyces sp. NPDC086077]|uniref:hypothetical protein n=1 Tax=Streptomyces sp. NPDC086077 TaxID=3154862 RepID=UPI00341E5CC9
MTPSSIRRRPRRTTAHISVRVAHALLGGVIAILWLVWPELTASPSGDRPTALAPTVPARSAAAQEQETFTADLVLPLVALGTAAVLAAYTYVRRTRRTRTRTTPGGAPSAMTSAPSHPLTQLDEQSQALLVEADDCVRAAREELAAAGATSTPRAMEPFAQAVREAEWELSAAFAMRQRYDDGVPAEASARRQALAGIVGRCTEAGRRLDAQAAGFDAVRGLERDIRSALEAAEARFREVAGRTSAAGSALAELGRRYASTASAPVVGFVEQAKDRLVFTTVHLNQARQAADANDPGSAAAHLRAAEGAIAQAATFETAVERLVGELSTAERLTGAALTGAEAEIAGARQRMAEAEVEAARARQRTTGPAGGAQTSPVARIPVGELKSRIMHADAVLAGVRETLTGGPYDPLDALRRVVRAVAPVAAGWAGVLSVAGELVARSTTAGAADFVATHRGAVGAEARTRLATARRLLTEAPLTADVLAADALARTALHLAEQDVRMHGTPTPGTTPHSTGVGGALLGGILLAGDLTPGSATSFGGPGTRARRNFPLS